jgi:hypothetical protein
MARGLVLWLVLVLATGLPQANAGAPGASKRSRFTGGGGGALTRAFGTAISNIRDTAFCVDLFGSAGVPRTTACVGGALKLNVPSLNQNAVARAEGRRQRRVYLAGGVSDSVLFGGYNPLFGGWNFSHGIPLGQGLGAGLFAGGPYTGFFVDTPTPLSFGGWVMERGPPHGQTAPEPFAAITLSVPGLSHLGLSLGVRLWIFTPVLGPIVRPLQRPAWWVHNRRKSLERYLLDKARPVLRPLGRPARSIRRSTDRRMDRARGALRKRWPRSGRARARCAPRPFPRRSVARQVKRRSRIRRDTSFPRSIKR